MCALTRSPRRVYMALKPVIDVRNGMAGFRFAERGAERGPPASETKRTVRVASVVVACLTALLISTGFAPGRATADPGAAGTGCTLGWSVVSDANNSFLWQNMTSSVNWVGFVQLLENHNETCVITGIRVAISGPALGGTLSLTGNPIVTFTVQYPVAYDKDANAARNSFGNLYSWTPAAGTYTGYTIETRFDVNSRGADEFVVHAQGIPAVVTTVGVTFALPMGLLGRGVKAQIHVGPDLCECKVTDLSIPDGTGSHPFWAAYVHAHPDDWQLFESPDSTLAYRGGYNLLFVYLTAGDAGIDPWYWRARQESAEASVRLLAGSGIEDSWWATICYAKTSDICHNVWEINYGRTTSLFMRLPDGNQDGGGFNATGFKSLARLRDGNITNLSAVDGSATYAGWDDLYLTVKAMLSAYAPFDSTTKINAPDFDRVGNSGDHSDHLAVGDLVYAITIGAGTPWSRAWFIDYPIAYADDRYPVNLDASGYQLKKDLFMAYNTRMHELTGIDDYTTIPWFFENCFQRDYVRVA